MRRQASNNTNTGIINSVKNSSASIKLKKNAIDVASTTSLTAKTSNKLINKNKYLVLTEFSPTLDFKKVLKNASSNERLWHSVEVFFF